MKKLFISLALLAVAFGGNRALAQVPESPEWASRIKSEGLGHSTRDGSRLTLLSV